MAPRPTSPVTQRADATPSTAAATDTRHPSSIDLLCRIQRHLRTHDAVLRDALQNQAAVVTRSRALARVPRALARLEMLRGELQEHAELKAKAPIPAATYERRMAEIESAWKDIAVQMRAWPEPPDDWAAAKMPIPLHTPSTDTEAIQQHAETQREKMQRLLPQEEESWLGAHDESEQKGSLQRLEALINDPGKAAQSISMLEDAELEAMLASSSSSRSRMELTFDLILHTRGAHSAFVFARELCQALMATGGAVRDRAVLTTLDLVASSRARVVSRGVPAVEGGQSGVCHDVSALFEPSLALEQSVLSLLNSRTALDVPASALRAPPKSPASAYAFSMRSVSDSLASTGSAFAGAATVLYHSVTSSAALDDETAGTHATVRSDSGVPAEECAVKTSLSGEPRRPLQAVHSNMKASRVISGPTAVEIKPADRATGPDRAFQGESFEHNAAEFLGSLLADGGEEPADGSSHSVPMIAALLSALPGPPSDADASRRSRILVIARWYAFRHLRTMICRTHSWSRQSSASTILHGRGQTLPLLPDQWTCDPASEVALSQLHRAAYNAVARAATNTADDTSVSISELGSTARQLMSRLTRQQEVDDTSASSWAAGEAFTLSLQEAEALLITSASAGGDECQLCTFWVQKSASSGHLRVRSTPSFSLPPDAELPPEPAHTLTSTSAVATSAISTPSFASTLGLLWQSKAEPTPETTKKAPKRIQHSRVNVAEPETLIALKNALVLAAKHAEAVPGAELHVVVQQAASDRRRHRMSSEAATLDWLAQHLKELRRDQSPAVERYLLKETLRALENRAAPLRAITQACQARAIELEAAFETQEVRVQDVLSVLVELRTRATA